MKSLAAILTGMFLISFVLTGDLLSATGKSVVRWINTTSTLKGKNNRYGAGNLLDGSSGSWCEGAKGDGIGEKIVLEFWKEETLSSIFLINGLKSKKDFSKNNRVKGIKINDESYILKDSPGLQKITFKKALRTKKLVLKIESVYPGTKWKDTCIAEIGINRPVNVTDDYGDDHIGSISGIDWLAPDELSDGSSIMLFNRALMFFENAVPCGDESCPVTTSGYCNKISKGKYRCAYVDQCYGMMVGKMEDHKVVRVCKNLNREFILRIVKGKPEVEFKGKRMIIKKEGHR
jgi:hypothetical protein